MSTLHRLSTVELTSSSPVRSRRVSLFISFPILSNEAVNLTPVHIYTHQPKDTTIGTSLGAFILCGSADAFAGELRWGGCLVRVAVTAAALGGVVFSAPSGRPPARTEKFSLPSPPPLPCSSA